MRNKKLLVISLIILLAIMAFLQESKAVISVQEQPISKEFDKVVKQVLEPGGVKRFNGIIVVAKDSKIIYKYANGYADIKNKKLINEKTNFNLASLSKQFTAMAIMILHEQGKLDIDDCITEYITELECREVTIRHLLTHTGLLPDYYKLAISDWADKTKPMSNEDIIGLFKDPKMKPYGTPGSYYSYSNTGYLLLATIVERVSKQEFNQFVQANIFVPMNMKNSLSYSLIENPPILNRAYGYKNRNSIALYDLTFLDGEKGPGGFYSNVEDLLKWDEVLRTEKLVKRTTLDIIFTPYTLNNGDQTAYGLGWFVKEKDGVKTVYHDGSWVGFRTRMLRNLKNNYTIIFMTNVPDETPFKAIDQIEEIISGIND